MARMLGVIVFIVVGMGLSTTVAAQGAGSTASLDADLQIVEDSLSPSETLSLTATFTNPGNVSHQYDVYLGAFLPDGNQDPTVNAIGPLVTVAPDGSLALGNFGIPGTWVPVMAGVMLAPGESLNIDFERLVTADGQPFGEYVLFAVGASAGAVDAAQGDFVAALASIIDADLESLVVQ